MRRGRWRGLLPRMSLRVWVLLSYAVVLVLPPLAVLATGALDRELRVETRSDLEAQAYVWAELVAHAVEREQAPLAEVAASLGPRLATVRDQTLNGVQIVDAQGIVVATSGRQHGHRLDDREVLAALAGAPAWEERPRSSVRAGPDVPWTGPSRFADVRVFVAVPIEVDGTVVGAVVVSRTPREQFQTLLRLVPGLGWGLFAVAVATFAIAIGTGHWGCRSLQRLSSAALRIARDTQPAPELPRLQASHVREVGAVAGALETMRQHLQARLNYIDEFAGNVAHEFRTPIATLRGTFELMSDDPGMPAAQRERFVANALAELGRLEATVDGLLSLARAERPDVRARVDLQGVLVAACADQPEVVVEGPAAVVHGSAGQIHTVVANLVANAHQHGGASARIVVRGFTNARETGFEVIDDGPGIAAANLERVFDRFFTTDRREGLGLGLALVRSVCRAHGGEVTATSQPGRTVLRVVLPRAR